MIHPSIILNVNDKRIADKIYYVFYVFIMLLCSYERYDFTFSNYLMYVNVIQAVILFLDIYFKCLIKKKVQKLSKCLEEIFQNT